jgi:hypothetical protein
VQLLRICLRRDAADLGPVERTTDAGERAHRNDERTVGIEGVHAGAAQLPEHLGVEADPADVSLRFEIGSGHPVDLVAGEVDPQELTGPTVLCHGDLRPSFMGCHVPH